MRCRACDKPLKSSEIIWRQDLGQHEDLCRKCRNYIHTEMDKLLQRSERLDLKIKYEEDE